MVQTYTRKKRKGVSKRKVAGHERKLPSGKIITVKPYYRKKRTDIRKYRTVKKSTKRTKSTRKKSKR